jgi:hypothetical protein
VVREKKETREPLKVKSTTPSIKDALSSLGSKKQPAINPSAGINDEPLAVEDDADLVAETDDNVLFSEDDLHIQWDKYINGLKTEEPRMYNALRTQELPFKADLVIQVQFRNNGQIDDFKSKIKPPLLAFLRTRLRNNLLEIEEVLQSEEFQPNAKHYTDSDKLKYMTEKNPALQKLRQEFNLDFD